MNPVPVIVRNPAYVEELEPDGGAVDQADVTPLISGDTPIITVPASEDQNVAEDASEDDEDDEEDEELRDIVEKLESLDKEVEELRKEAMELLSSTLEAARPQKQAVVPQVEVWDTGKAREQEYNQYPDSDIKEIRNRLSNQVWDLLQIMQEQVDQHTCNSKDIKLIDRLNAISVMHDRISSLSDNLLKRQAERP